MAVTLTHQPPAAVGADRPQFYFWMAVAMMATAFLGFTPTFWAPLARGVPERSAVIAVHAMLFFGWTLFVILQTRLVATGKVVRHRDIGLIGISLATAMVIFGVMAAVGSAQRAAAANHALGGEAFMIVPLAAMLTFGVLVAAAIGNVRRPDWHKRLMLVATASILEAAIARVFIVYVVMGGQVPPFQGTAGLAGLPGPPPPVAGVLPPAIIGLLFVVAGMIYDRRTVGKIHPAYWWGGGLVLAVQLLKIPFSETALWHGFARWMMSLAA